MQNLEELKKLGMMGESMGDENKTCILLYAANIIAKSANPRMNSFCLQNKCAMFRPSEQDFHLGRCALAGNDVLYNFMDSSRGKTCE